MQDEIDTGVWAGDNKGRRMLTVRQTINRTLLGTESAVPKPVNTFNEHLHKYDLHSLFRRKICSHMGILRNTTDALTENSGARNERTQQAHNQLEGGWGHKAQRVGAT